MQCAAAAYRKALAGIGAVCSMSRKGDPFVNAPMESFFKALKAERVDQAEYATRDVFVLLGTFYNPRHLHSAIGYVTPDQREKAAA